jgi:hypothetical protein
MHTSNGHVLGYTHEHLFLALPTKARILVFRFIIEYIPSSLMDIEPLGNNRSIFYRLYFCMVKYLSFHNSSFFALRYFLM